MAAAALWSKGRRSRLQEGFRTTVGLNDVHGRRDYENRADLESLIDSTVQLDALDKKFEVRLEGARRLER